MLSIRSAIKELRQSVMGMNRRNLSLILPSNPRKNLRSVNEKVTCKKLLEKGDVPVPKTIMVCSSHADTAGLPSIIRDYETFVIKPSRGYGGEGILLVSRDGDHYSTDGGEEQLRLRDLVHHVLYIIDGVFSLDNYSDVALIEETVVPDDLLGSLSKRGVPDIRVIVYRGEVISSMLRLPTELSKGKANLHQGGIGVGIDIMTGLTTTAILKGGFIMEHPDTHKRLDNIRIPEWDRILDISVKMPGLVRLGYVGIDFVIDRTHGLLVLEVNGRPGLQIQLANNQGLRKRYGEVIDSAQ